MTDPTDLLDVYRQTCFYEALARRQGNAESAATFGRQATRLEAEIAARVDDQFQSARGERGQSRDVEGWV